MKLRVALKHISVYLRAFIFSAQPCFLNCIVYIKQSYVIVLSGTVNTWNANTNIFDLRNSHIKQIPCLHKTEKSFITNTAIPYIEDSSFIVGQDKR